MNILVQVLINGIILGGLYALMAQGLAIIFGVMRVINLAHGEFLLLGAYAAWWANDTLGLDPFLASPLLALLGFGVGWLVCRVLIVPVIERPVLMPLLLTFGLAAVLASGLRSVFSTTPRFTGSTYSNVIVTVANYRLPVANAMMLAFAIVFLVLLSQMLKRTRIGKSLRAASQNTEAARIVGIELPFVYCAAFGIGSAVVFVSGALFSATQGFFPFMGPTFTLKAFAIVVLGGLGRIGGTFFTALLLGVLESLIASYVPNVGTGLGVAAAFLLVVVVLAIRPQGIFAGPQPEGA